MNTTLTRLLPLLCLLAPRAEPRQIEDLGARLDELVGRLERELRAEHVPGAAIAVVVDDEVVLARGLGLARLEPETPASAETLFAIGSASKAFTATLIGTLVDEGKLSFDDPVTRWLPYFELHPRGAQAGEPVSLRDLLSHRTGFTRMSLLWAVNDQVPRETILRTAAGAEPFADFRAGFHYNNVMYLAAGVAAGAAGGKDWDALLAERLLEPLGMEHTNTSTLASQKDERLAFGYEWSEESQRFEHLPMRVLDSIGPAGSINSNALDMARWVRFQLADGSLEETRPIERETLLETRRPQISIAGDVSYGLGWFLRRWNGRPLFEHGGNIDGFCSQVACLPEEGIGFALLMNVTATPLQQGSLGIVFDSLLGEEAGEPAQGPTASTDEDFTPLLGTYIGNFAHFQDAEFEVLVKNDRLAVDVPGQMVFELRPPDEDGRRPFVLTDEIAVVFELDEEGRAVVMHMHQSGYVFEIFRKGYEPELELPLAELARYVGSYRDEGRDRLYLVSIRNNRLAMDRSDALGSELFPPDDTGRWAYRLRQDVGVRFEEGEDGSIVGLTLQGEGEAHDMRRLSEGARALPSLEQLLALHRGDAAEPRGTLVGKGGLHMVHAGLRGAILTRYMAPDHYRVDMDLGTFGATGASTDGERAWRWMTSTGSRELDGREARQVLLGSASVVAGDWARYYESIVVLREGDSGGRPTWVVRLENPDSPPVTYQVDAQTGDVLECDATIAEGPVELPVHVRFEDWRDVEGGGRMPFRMISENDASGRSVIEFESFEVQEGVDPAEFSPPE